MLQRISNILAYIFSVGFFALVGFFGITPSVSAAIKNSDWLSSGVLNVPTGGVCEILLNFGLIFFQITIALAVASEIIFMGQYFLSGQADDRISSVRHNMAYALLIGITAIAGLVVLYSIKRVL